MIFCFLYINTRVQPRERESGGSSGGSSRERDAGRGRRDGLHSVVSPAWGLYTSDCIPPHPLSAYIPGIHHASVTCSRLCFLLLVSNSLLFHVMCVYIYIYRMGSGQIFAPPFFAVIERMIRAFSKRRIYRSTFSIFDLELNL